MLELLLVNGTPLLDVSLDLSPRDPSRFVGVVRVPQRSAMLPRLLRSRNGMAVFNKWVSEFGNFGEKAEMGGQDLGNPRFLLLLTFRILFHESRFGTSIPIFRFFKTWTRNFLNENLHDGKYRDYLRFYSSLPSYESSEIH